MKVRSRLVLLLGAMLAAGCQTTDPSVELLESELRWMEDQLYAMDAQLSQTLAQLQSCRQDNLAMRTELQSQDQQRGHDNRTRRRSSPTDRGQREGNGRDSDLTDDDEFGIDIEIPDSFRPPNIDPGEPTLELPEPSDATEDRSAPSKMPARDTDAEGIPVGEVQGVTYFVPTDGSLNRDRIDDRSVARIVLNRRLTGGLDFDGRPGDEGVMVVIEPQDATGNYLPAAGPVTITVKDAVRSDRAARLGRWHLTAEQTAALMRTTLMGKGIHLELPWPSIVPENSQLKVIVEYETVTGQRLTASREIHVDLLPMHKPYWQPHRAGILQQRAQSWPVYQPAFKRFAPFDFGPASHGVSANRDYPAIQLAPRKHHATMYYAHPMNRIKAAIESLSPVANRRQQIAGSVSLNN